MNASVLLQRNIYKHSLPPTPIIAFRRDTQTFQTFCKIQMSIAKQVLCLLWRLLVIVITCIVVPHIFVPYCTLLTTKRFRTEKTFSELFECQLLFDTIHFLELSDKFAIVVHRWALGVDVDGDVLELQPSNAGSHSLRPIRAF